MKNSRRLSHYISLTRLDKPIGILLLLWPTLWALWLASDGRPEPQLLIIFIMGVILMRSAGCILNDIADRHFDAHVRRTRERPMATGKVSLAEAFLLTAILSLTAFLLVLQCNGLTIALSFVAAGLAVLYPFLKRITNLPQLGLGLAFAFGVPMAFAAETGAVNASAWFLFFTAMLWPVMYDTLYAMTDREDDIKIGVKSTAILFGKRDKQIVAMLQLLLMMLLIAIGFIFKLHSLYYFFLLPVLLLFFYQQWLIKDRDAQQCLKAFLNNQWVGLLVFTGILLSSLQ